MKTNSIFLNPLSSKVRWKEGSWCVLMRGEYSLLTGRGWRTTHSTGCCVVTHPRWPAGRWKWSPRWTSDTIFQLFQDANNASDWEQTDAYLGLGSKHSGCSMKEAWIKANFCARQQDPAVPQCLQALPGPCRSRASPPPRHTLPLRPPLPPRSANSTSQEQGCHTRLRCQRGGAKQNRCAPLGFCHFTVGRPSSKTPTKDAEQHLCAP